MSLIIKVLTANLTRNTQHITQMDPYVVFEVGEEKRQTKVHQEGGKNPVWNQVLNIQINGVKYMKVIVMEKDKIKDDFVGEATLDIEKYIMDRKQHEENVPLTYKQKSSGTLKLVINYVGEDAQGHNWGKNQNQGGMNMQSGWGQMPNNSGWNQHNPSCFDEFNKK